MQSASKRFSRFGIAAPLLSRVCRIPRRYVVIAWIVGLFVAVNTVARIGLLVFEGGTASYSLTTLTAIFLMGIVHDLAAAAYVVVPFALLALVFPGSPRGNRLHALAATGSAFVAIGAMLFVALAEGVFWNEFSSRFNFIAVDYLIYTREVVGNIRESYPAGVIFGALGILALAVTLTVRKGLWRAAVADGGRLPMRLIATAVAFALPVLSYTLVGDGLRDRVDSASARELAGNGYYEFMRAFRSNDLDFRTFYRTLSRDAAERELRSQFVQARSRGTFVPVAHHPLNRKVSAAGTAQRKHVVLVSMESLGADYVEAFGGKPGLTPNLDRLARDGMMFTRMYATGLRTVRGLEALTLSMPPTPGHAVPMRKNNASFQTIGEVFKDKGYDALYLYGGYSYFDNMNDFFGGNGYTVIDRTAIDKSNISHENIWGVADEDLFRQTIREIDARAAQGKHVFAHVMTTSNHRPFTYPAGRVDLPSGSGRDGAVKYSDWAIGAFIKEASSKPWFADTVFVFVADHTSHGRGRTDLPPENYHIPMIIYSPGFVVPARVETVASQIDVAPTLLALLNFSYTAEFFGQDILTEGKLHQRAFMANYLTVGYMENGLIVELSPKRKARVVDAATAAVLDESDPRAGQLIDEAVAYYQVATNVLRETLKRQPH